jgi:phosphate starvation-inducible membrane PsiE
MLKTEKMNAKENKLLMLLYFIYISAVALMVYLVDQKYEPDIPNRFFTIAGVLAIVISLFFRKRRLLALNICGLSMLIALLALYFEPQVYQFILQVF